jgi:hypothetical protein
MAGLDKLNREIFFDLSSRIVAQRLLFSFLMREATASVFIENELRLLEFAFT